MSKIFRVYVEKKTEYKVEAFEVLNNLKTQLNINLSNLNIVNRYDLSGLLDADLISAVNTVLSEPMVDDYYIEEYPIEGKKVFAIEYLPGQYDQRADACEQCLKILGSNDVRVRCARVFVFDDTATDEEIEKIQAFLVNPVDQRIDSLDKPITL